MIWRVYPKGMRNILKSVNNNGERIKDDKKMRLMKILCLGAFFIACCQSFCAEKLSVNIEYNGAVRDGKTLCTTAIQKAIDACDEAGGGKVVIPAGNFLAGTIVLKSNVELHLQKDAVLLGSFDLKDYPMKLGKRRHHGAAL